MKVMKPGPKGQGRFRRVDPGQRYGLGSSDSRTQSRCSPKQHKETLLCRVSRVGRFFASKQTVRLADG
jgi:hypothetical protein